MGKKAAPKKKTKKGGFGKFLLGALFGAAAGAIAAGTTQNKDAGATCSCAKRPAAKKTTAKKSTTAKKPAAKKTTKK